MADNVSFTQGRHSLFRINSGAIRFKVKGSSCTLYLVSRERPYSVIYQVDITHILSRIRCVPIDDEIKGPSHNIINPSRFEEFCTSWYNGRVRIGISGRSNHFLEYVSVDKDIHQQIGYIKFNTPSTSYSQLEWSVEAPPISTLAVAHKQVEGGKLHWVPMTGPELPPDALIGGFENEPTYIARAYHNHSLCPGRYVPSKRVALIPWGHCEHKKIEFEILCGYDVEWVKTTSNIIPENAFEAGLSEVADEPLYIGRAMHDGNLLTGKVHALYKTCYLPYRGREVEVGSYELLVDPNVPQRGFIYNENMALSGISDVDNGNWA